MLQRGVTRGMALRWDNVRVEPATAAAGTAGAYARIQGLIADGRCVVLDGGTGDGAAAACRKRPPSSTSGCGATSALIGGPDDGARACTASYVELGCDVISTNTWGLPTAVRHDGPQAMGQRPAGALDGRRPPRPRPRARGGRPGRARDRTAPWPSASTGTWTRPRARRRSSCSRACSRRSRPTSSCSRRSRWCGIRPTTPCGACWRRACRCGSASAAAGTASAVCSASTGAAPRATRSGARRGASRSWARARCSSTACRPDHVDRHAALAARLHRPAAGRVPQPRLLRMRLALRGGVAELALAWRDEGAQIVGGCCGVGPDHIARAREALAGTSGRGRTTLPTASWSPRPAALRNPGPQRPAGRTSTGATCFPSPFPTWPASRASSCPHRAASCVWKHLFQHDVGRDLRCLDVGCGTGLAQRPARPERGDPRARDRPRPPGGGQHPGERLPERGGRASERGRRRPVSLGARRTLRADRGQPLPDAGRPVRAGDHAPPARLLGPQPDRPPDQQSCPRRSRLEAWPTSCSCR